MSGGISTVSGRPPASLQLSASKTSGNETGIGAEIRAGALTGKSEFVFVRRHRHVRSHLIAMRMCSGLCGQFCLMRAGTRRLIAHQREGDQSKEEAAQFSDQLSALHIVRRRRGRRWIFQLRRGLCRRALRLSRFCITYSPIADDIQFSPIGFVSWVDKLAGISEGINHA